MIRAAVFTVALLAAPASAARDDAATLLLLSASQRESQPARALRTSERALRADPAVKGGERARGAALLALRRWADAAAAYRLALAVDPADRAATLGLARRSAARGNSIAPNPCSMRCSPAGTTAKRGSSVQSWKPSSIRLIQRLRITTI